MARDLCDDTTVGVDLRSECHLTGETTYASAVAHPDESGLCEHRWVPVRGGRVDREFGGAEGHGGGVVVREICCLCGAERTTDTWATGPGGDVLDHDQITYRAGDESRTVDVAAIRDAGGADRHLVWRLAMALRRRGEDIHAADPAEMMALAEEHDLADDMAAALVQILDA